MLWRKSQMLLGSGMAVIWYRPEAAALIRPLAWELPYAVCVALKRPKEKKRVSTEKCWKYEISTFDIQNYFQIPYCGVFKYFFGLPTEGT